MEHFWVTLIGDMWSFHLAIMGILVSVLTLLYASLCGKVEELNYIKQSEEYALMNRAIAMSNSIDRLHKLNKKIMKSLIISFCFFILTTIIKYLPEVCIQRWIASFIAIITIGFLVFGVKLAHSVYNQYQKETFNS